MKLTRTTACNEIEKLFNWFPRRDRTAAKEEALTNDLLEMTANWSEDGFVETCKRIRRKEKFFPLPVDFESVYLQVVSEQRSQVSEYDRDQEDYERRLAEEERIYQRIFRISRDEQELILERAKDMAASVLDKFRDETGALKENAAWLQRTMIKHQAEIEKGLAIQLYRENYE